MDLYLCTVGIGNYYVATNGYSDAQKQLEDLLNECNYGYLRDRVVTNIKCIAKGITDKNFISDKYFLLQDNMKEIKE